jgi:DNA-binding MarR family transcriptional regulator
MLRKVKLAIENEDEVEILRLRLEALYDRLGFKIRRVHQIAQAIFADTCIDYGITTTQFGVLFVLSRVGPQDQATVARLIALDRSTTGLVVSLLEKRGYLSRRSSDHDRRRRILHLTPEGEVILERLHKPAERSMTKLLDCLSVQQRRQLVRLLSRLSEGGNTELENLPQLEPLNKRPGFIIRKAHQRSVAIFVQELGDLQITPTQFGVLFILARCGEIDQVTLARLLGADRSTIALVVKLLVERGSIVKTAAIRDQRRRILKISPRGIELINQAQPIAAEELRKLANVYLPKELDWWLFTLDRIIRRHEARFSTVIPESVEI